MIISKCTFSYRRTPPSIRYAFTGTSVPALHRWADPRPAVPIKHPALLSVKVESRSRFKPVAPEADTVRVVIFSGLGGLFCLSCWDSAQLELNRHQPARLKPDNTVR